MDIQSRRMDLSELFATLKIKYGADVDKHILSLYVGEL